MKDTIDWQIHYVPMEDSEDNTMADAHTYGLDKYGQRELCVVLRINPKICVDLLSRIGIDAVFRGKNLTPGVHQDPLRHGYDIELLSLPDDPTLYVIVSDDNNKLPSDKDCKYPYNQQYIFAERLSEYHKEKRKEIS